jgi:hypothetical protein
MKCEGLCEKNLWIDDDDDDDDDDNLWQNSPTWDRAVSSLRFVDHTQ